MNKIKYSTKSLNSLNYLDKISLWYYNVVINNSSNRIVHEQNGGVLLSFLFVFRR